MPCGQPGGQPQGGAAAALPAAATRNPAEVLRVSAARRPRAWSLGGLGVAPGPRRSNRATSGIAGPCVYSADAVMPVQVEARGSAWLKHRLGPDGVGLFRQLRQKKLWSVSSSGPQVPNTITTPLRSLVVVWPISIS